MYLLLVRSVDKVSRSQENTLLGHLQAHGGVIKAAKYRDLRYIIAGIVKSTPGEAALIVESLAKDGKVSNTWENGRLAEVKLAPVQKRPTPNDVAKRKVTPVTKKEEVATEASEKMPPSKAEKLLADANALLMVLRSEARQSNGAVHTTKDALARSAKITSTSANHALTLLRRNSLYTASLGPNPIYMPDMSTTLPSLEQAKRYVDEMAEKKRLAITKQRQAAKTRPADKAEVPSLAKTERSKVQLEDALLKLGVKHIRLKEELEATKKLKQELEDKVNQLMDELEQAKRAPNNQAINLIIQHLGGDE